MSSRPPSTLLAAALLIACTPAAPPPSSGPDIGKRAVAEHGIVAAGNGYASDAGIAMLQALRMPRPRCWRAHSRFDDIVTSPPVDQGVRRRAGARA